MIGATPVFLYLFIYTHQLYCIFLIYSKCLVCILQYDIINIKILCSASEIGSIKGKHHFFHIIFLNKDISTAILDNAMNFCMALLHIDFEGNMSQIFYLGLSSYFTSFRK